MYIYIYIYMYMCASSVCCHLSAGGSTTTESTGNVPRPPLADSRSILGRFSAEWIPGVAARLRFVITRPAATCMKDNDDGWWTMRPSVLQSRRLRVRARPSTPTVKAERRGRRWGQPRHRPITTPPSICTQETIMSTKWQLKLIVGPNPS